MCAHGHDSLECSRTCFSLFFFFFSFDLKKLVPSRKVVCYYISKESSYSVALACYKHTDLPFSQLCCVCLFTCGFHTSCQIPQKRISQAEEKGPRKNKSIQKEAFKKREGKKKKRKNQNNRLHLDILAR